GKSGRKGRKSIPRKITQGEGDEGTFVQPAPPPPIPLPQQPPPLPPPQPPPPHLPVISNNLPPHLPQPGVLKPFVIQNPDTDDEIDEDEEVEIPIPPPAPNTGQMIHEKIAPIASVMNFQPLNVNPEKDAETIARMANRRPRDEDIMEVDKRPRRQSQRRSPKVHTSDMEQTDSEENETEADVNDNTDTDWVPGSRRRSRGKSDAGEKGKIL
ncbi:unnamed protein product, partial [Lymnaea stagnalis]